MYKRIIFPVQIVFKSPASGTFHDLLTWKRRKRKRKGKGERKGKGKEERYTERERGKERRGEVRREKEKGKGRKKEKKKERKKNPPTPKQKSIIEKTPHPDCLNSWRQVTDYIALRHLMLAEHLISSTWKLSSPYYLIYHFH